MRHYPHKEFKERYMKQSKEWLINYLYLCERESKVATEVIKQLRNKIKEKEEFLNLYRAICRTEINKLENN